MAKQQFLLSLDQGTTSTRAMVFSTQGEVIASAQQAFRQYFPHDAWVEHDGEEIWQTVVNTIQQALQKARCEAKDIAALGISNQRETTLLWNRKTGALLSKAIVWQDRRTADVCDVLADAKTNQRIQQKTGLLLDPYFSASKLAWLLNHIPGARASALQGELAFGTIDSFLLWRLTGGQVHATDATNAARTLLFNIVTQTWDEELLKLFAIPASVLPEVRDNNAWFGTTEKSLFDASIPITGMAGDQQAALIGQACFTPGMVKSTYGTGCFMVLNTGEKLMYSRHRLLATVAYRLKDKVIYALEGSIFVAGAAVQWLRDALHLIKTASDTESLVNETTDNAGVYLVPAFTGLGAPYWDPNARGAILGLTRDSGIKHIVRAALESVCYQSRDLLLAMQQDAKLNLQMLRVDGGMIANEWLMQFLADILGVNIVRAKMAETSALGAAYLAGLGCGVYSSLNEIESLWQSDRHFSPQLNENERMRLYQGWQNAIQRVRTTSD